MTTRIKVKNAETGASVDMDLEQDNTVEEIIESAASYWEKQSVCRWVIPVNSSPNIDIFITTLMDYPTDCYGT